MKYLFLILSLAFTCSLFGQDHPLKITLKNGDKIKASILSYEEDGSLILKSEHIDRFKISIDHIEKIEDPKKLYQIRPHYFSFDLSINNSQNIRGRSIFFAWQKTNGKLLRYGGGFGVDSYDLEIDRPIIPIFASIGLFGSQRKVNPYINLNLGYGFTLADRASRNFESSNGGIFINPRIGIQVRSGDIFFNFFTGMKFQKADYLYGGGDWEILEENSYRRLEYGIGMNF